MLNKVNAEGIKGISRAILTAVITFIIAIAVFATSAFAGLVNQYNVKIINENDEIVITTSETEANQILSQANIVLADSDKIDISKFIAGEGGVIKIDKLNNINIEANGVINNYSVYANTVEGALKEIGINASKNLRMNYQLTDEIIDGMVITILPAKTVKLTVNNTTTKYAIPNGTVADLLKLANVTLDSNDYVKPALNTKLKANMKVKVYKVEYKKVTKTESVDYKIKTKTDSSMENGSNQVIKYGVDGEAEVTYKIKYVNGKESSKKELSRQVTKKPVDKVIKVGTKNSATSSSVKSNGVKTKNGYSVGQKVSGNYTHYCACATCNGNSRGVTASGKRISNGMSDPHYIACNWLPLGSVISVDGTNYTVVDRGGSGLSTTGRIDIFTPEGHSACYKYGTGSCSIEIVRLGW